MTTPRDITNARVRPLQTALQAYKFTFVGVDTILRLGWLAALGLSMSQFFIQLSPPELNEDGTQMLFAPGDLAYFVVMAVVGFGIQVMVAVGWHRTVLLGETHDAKRFYLRFGSPELVYAVIAVALVLFFAMGMGMLPAALEMHGTDHLAVALFFLAGPVLATLVVSRSSLVLAAVALGKPVDIRQSWEASKGNGARLAALYLLVGTPLVLAQLLLPMLMGHVAALGFGSLGDVVISFVGMLAMLIALCTMITAISLAYRQLVLIRPVG